jgi:hypothetical protein
VNNDERVPRQPKPMPCEALPQPAGAYEAPRILAKRSVAQTTMQVVNSNVSPDQPIGGH